VGVEGLVGLEEYKEKRDFASTPEPAGVVADTGLCRFVVQEHHARQLHWDFRLELDGVLKSWAVPKGPPEEPGVRRLAVQVEDHPIEYVDFQGDIPSGYGAGTVKIWDSGTFDLLFREETKIVLVLKGERLKGRYNLVKTGQPKGWILLKSK
jgi:DNA ligase D-like protein (predicted 3'-phosphoesterase)